MQKETILVIVAWRPFCDAIWVLKEGEKHRLEENTIASLNALIDLHAPVESISKPQNL